jgi:replicative DNA helicase
VKPFTNIEAEQAVIGALLIDEHAFDTVADLLRPELFGAVDAHRLVAEDILALRGQDKPADPVLIDQRLAGRIPPGFTFALSRGFGTAGNVRHYVAVLQSLWLKRAAREIASAILNDAADMDGAEFVARYAEKLSAIETARGAAPRKLGEIVYSRMEELEREYKNPDVVPTDYFPTGFSKLDSMLGGGLHVGHLTTFAARPGVGKSALVSAMADNLAARGVPVGIFQLEDYGDSLANRAISRRAKIASVLMRDGRRWSPHHWQKINTWVAPTMDYPIWVDDAHGQTVHGITGAMRRMVREHGVKVFFLDNLAEVVVDGPERGEERHDRALGRIAKTYRDAAKAVGAVPVLLVHLNREVAKRKDAAPLLSDIKNSGEIEDASHVVALMWRPEDAQNEAGRPQIILDLGKNRDGPKGRVCLDWLEDYMAVAEPRNAA